MPDPDDPLITDADAAAQEILLRVGTELRIALPLGLGKPVTLLNALTRRACDDPTIRLTIFTALTLEIPSASGDMEGRFFSPARVRLFGDYPEILYARLLRDGTLPDNIEVREFFLMAGRWLGVPHAQQSYIPTNYSHALDLIQDAQPNLVLQLLGGVPDRPNLSCNTDITVDLLRLRQAGEMRFFFAAEMNGTLPEMAGDAPIDAREVDLILDPLEHFELFSTVKRPVGMADHAIGLHVSRLIPDGGTLQIGIGAIGDAIAHALVQRHENRLGPLWSGCPFPLDGPVETRRFETGLYAVTEMLVDGLLRLFEAGILRREVEGAAIHAGFFVDCRDFYRRLREMPPESRSRIQMKPVSFTNTLYGDEQARRAARQHARFVNSAMKVTLQGAVVSDAVADGQVVSGVGGQFDFVEQAFALKGGRAIICINATRKSGGHVESNIVWDYPHCTIPWHFRDIVVTEYGVADLRGKSDAEAIAALIAIADSQFQRDLEKRAKDAGKLPKGHVIPPSRRRNTLDSLRHWLGEQEAQFPAFPFGTDFDETEQILLPALSELRHRGATLRGRFRLFFASVTDRKHPQEDAALARMGFADAGRGGLSVRALRGALRLSESK